VERQDRVTLPTRQTRRLFSKTPGKAPRPNLWGFAGGSGGANVCGRWKRAGGQGPIKGMSRGQRGNAGISCGRLRLGGYEEVGVRVPTGPQVFPTFPCQQEAL
jgi:hypothetical protein